MRRLEQQCCCIPRLGLLLHTLHHHRLDHPFILRVRTDTLNVQNDRETNLRVSNQHQLSVWAGGVEVVNCRNCGADAGHNRSIVLDTATRRLTTASWVVQSFGGSSGMGGNNQVYNSSRRAISCRYCCFTSTKDVNPRALSLDNRAIDLVRSQKSLGQ